MSRMKEGRMTIMLKTMMRAAAAIVLVVAGFAIGFPLGQQRGFSDGTEWALVQADILAQEAGFSLPVDLEEGIFHVVVKQPPDLYKRAWQRADQYDREMRQRGNSSNTGQDGVFWTGIDRDESEPSVLTVDGVLCAGRERHSMDHRVRGVWGSGLLRSSFNF